MEEWKEYSLGDIVNLVIDYRGKTPLKLGGSWSQNGYRALSAKNIKTGAIVNEDSIRFVDEELYRRWMKDEVQRGDIFVTSEAPFAQIYPMAFLQYALDRYEVVQNLFEHQISLSAFSLA